MANSNYLCLQGGTIYDPVQSLDGVVQDLWIADGKIVAAPTASERERAERVETVNVKGYWVTPGAIDMHCHIAGPKVNAARRMLAQRLTALETADALTQEPVPPTDTIGSRYLQLGFTTAMEAAVPPFGARHAHLEFADIPYLDKGFLALVGNNHFLFEQIKVGETNRIDQFICWLLPAVRAYGLKIVNPGGIETWKQGIAQPADLDSPVPIFQVTPRAILRELAASADRLQLPHPVHIHANHLGRPGNAATTLATMQALEGLRGHLAHIQFHSYATPEDGQQLQSGVYQLAEYVNSHPNLTVDVGHVLFGKTISLTGDSALGHYLHQVTGNPWTSVDVECETGCGIVPIEYREGSVAHAVQWAVGLEWYLLIKDPWRLALSCDHPNGGVFWEYPRLLHFLMSRDARSEVIQRLPKAWRQRCLLAELDREYTVNEVLMLSRAAPARILGLPNKGHLQVGAAADICLYNPRLDIEAMWRQPVAVYKDGRLAYHDGQWAAAFLGQTLATLSVPAADPTFRKELRNWFQDAYSLALEQYELRPEEFNSDT